MAKSARAPKKKAARPAAAPHAAAKTPAPPNERARESAMLIARLGLDKKALDVVVLDVRGLSSYAEYVVVMTAESDPQLGAIADHVEAAMKERGERPIGIEGLRAGQWVLIDYGDVVAHVFYQDMRAFYDLEGLWADAQRTAVRD
jgi:ribosome-associated protein